MYDGIVYTI